MAKDARLFATEFLRLYNEKGGDDEANKPGPDRFETRELGLGMAVLLKPSHPSAKPVTQSLQATARALEVQLDVLEASTDREIEDAYSTLKPGAALLKRFPLIWKHSRHA